MTAFLIKHASALICALAVALALWVMSRLPEYQEQENEEEQP